MKKYIKPKMEIFKSGFPELLCASSDNPYWGGCWGEPEQDDEDDNPYWKGGWGK